MAVPSKQSRQLRSLPCMLHFVDLRVFARVSGVNHSATSLANAETAGLIALSCALRRLWVRHEQSEMQSCH